MSLGRRYSAIRGRKTSGEAAGRGTAGTSWPSWPLRWTRGGIRVHDATVLCPEYSSLRAVACLGVDANGDPCENAVYLLLSEPDVVQDGVGGGSFLCEDEVVLVELKRLLVGRVWRVGLDFVDQILVEENLC